MLPVLLTVRAARSTVPAFYHSPFTNLVPVCPTRVGRESRSRNAGGLHPAPPRGGCHLHSIPSVSLGAVQRLIGRLQDKIGMRFFSRRTPQPHTHGYGKRRRRLLLGQLPNCVPLARADASPLIAAVRSAWNLPPVAAAHAKFRRFDRGAQLLQMIDDFGSCFSGKKNCEFLPTATERLASTCHARQARRH